MEDIHRRHKEVPFGWALWVHQIFEAWRRIQRAPWDDPPRCCIDDEFHRLSAPR